VEADTLNFTDLDTFGLRAEVMKAVGDHLVTWGLEGSRDESHNTDHSTTVTTLRFPGPPFRVVQTSTDDRANAPDATHDSAGLFVQGEVAPLARLKVTAGLRYQQVSTEAEPTPGWDIAGLDFEDDAVVGALNALFALTDELNLFAGYGTAFRAPNIIERLFNGPTPEGAGFQILNPDLVSEESENFDLGVKYRRRDFWAEAVYFQTDIDEGIIQDFLTPAEVAALPDALRQEILASGAQFVVQQLNADRLRYQGFEVAGGYRLPAGFAVAANYTHLSGRRVGESAVPVEDTYSDKANLSLRWLPPTGRYWVEYRVRHNGNADTAIEEGEPVPAVGRELPSFTVHALAGGVRLFERGRQRHDVTVVVDNLTDELYAEFSNASFFRPESERSVSASYRVRF
jgi:outer membrane receptor protein involved in Fe transport